MSDLLFEISENLKGKKIEGYTKQTYLGKFDTIKTHIEIKNEKASKMFNREIGNYTSIQCNKLSPYDSNIKGYITDCLTDILQDYISSCNKRAKSFLIAGIGNKNFVSDSLGPKVNKNIIITRHAKINNPKVLDERLKTVSAISPSVLGVTGIETFNIISGVVERIKPDVIFVIDTLLANNYRYLGNCFQVSNVGLIPGSGVNNAQMLLDTNTLKTPTITIGVPLVVSASNFCSELNNELENLVVAPKDIDILVDNCALIIATSLNRAIHNKMSEDEILDYMN